MPPCLQGSKDQVAGGGLTAADSASAPDPPVPGAGSASGGLGFLQTQKKHLGV